MWLGESEKAIAAAFEEAPSSRPCGGRMAAAVTSYCGEIESFGAIDWRSPRTNRWLSIAVYLRECYSG